MKLYTEEQVKKAIELAQDYGLDCDDIYFYYNDNDIIGKLKPIELPSEEEIEDEIEDSSYSIEYDYGFRIGAKWVIERIKQQAKP